MSRSKKLNSHKWNWVPFTLLPIIYDHSALLNLTTWKYIFLCKGEGLNPKTCFDILFQTLTWKTPNLTQLYLGLLTLCRRTGCKIAVRISLITLIFHSFVLVPSLCSISKVCFPLKLLAAFQISHFTEKQRFKTFLLKQWLKAMFLTASFLHDIVWKMGSVSSSVSTLLDLLKPKCFLASKSMSVL